MDIDLMPASATPLIILPDMNETDIDAEWEAMYCRSRAMSDFLAGEITCGDYLDTLEHFGVEVPEYIDAWEDNLDLLYRCA